MTQRVVNYKYGTGNPVLPDGSVDVRDGIDNLQSFDVFMNADEDTYNQRDGGVSKTIAGAIKSTGFKPGSGDFVTGFTVMPGHRNIAWKNPSPLGDNNFYSWDGPIPTTGKFVPAGSTPETTGGVIAGAWRPRTDETLREELATSNGASLVGYAHYVVGAVLRKFADIFKTKVNVLDFGVVVGAVSSEVAEANLQAINKASAYAKSVGAGILEFPAGDIWIRPLTSGVNPPDLYCMMRSGVHFKGKGKLVTRLVRAGKTTCISVDPLEGLLSGAALRDMTVWGNPGVMGETNFPSNLFHSLESKDLLIDNVLFLDVPGLHAIDLNAAVGAKVTNCDFFGYDLSLRGGDTTYFPESIQLSMNPELTVKSKNIRIKRCRVGQSASYQAPLVFLGNHSGEGGGFDHAAEDVVVEDVIANGITKYMFRNKAWKGLTLLRCRQESGAARFLYLDYKPAYPEVGTPIAACEDITVKDCYHNGEQEFIYASQVSTVSDPIVRHRNINVVGGEVVGRSAANAIAGYYMIGLKIERLKISGSRKALIAYWCEDISVINPDWDMFEVDGVDVSDSTGFGAGKGFNKNLTIRGGRITNCKFSSIYLGSVNGYVIDGVDVSGASALDGTRNAIHIFGGSNNGVVRNVIGRNNGNAFAPAIGVNYTSGVNNVVENCDIYCTGEMTVNPSSGVSGEVRRIIYRTGIPTTGTWRKGTLIKNSSPAVGSPKGWVCTVAGTPGTWVSEGNL